MTARGSEQARTGHASGQDGARTGQVSTHDGARAPSEPASFTQLPTAWVCANRPASAFARRASALGALLAGALTASGAAAQGYDEFGAYGPTVEEQESPQHFALEIRFGPYLPNVDDGVAGEPYDSVFGDDNRYVFAVEFDWQIFRIPTFGTVGPGFGIGYTRSSGFGLEPDGTRSGQKSYLSLVPMYVVGVVRVDVLARDLGIPLVPYGKLGLGLVPWWTSDGDDIARDDAGTVGRDLSYGYQFALGGMIHLDPLEPSAARNMDATTGVNNAYAFIEWYNSDIDGFGSGDQMQVGTSTWMAGIAVEF